MKKTNRTLLIILLFVGAFQIVKAQNVGIGTVTPHPSSVLELKSDTTGLLIPRLDIVNLATAAPVNSPAIGLLAYNVNTTSGTGFHYWNGGAWVPLTSTATGGTNQTVSAGAGISVTQVGQDFIVTNTSPDQAVGLTGTGATNVTGTYPNFTVNTPPVTITGTGSATVTGTYPNFTVNAASGGTNQTVSAGPGISVTQNGQDFVVTNTSPNQPVALTGTGMTNITGTYPNFSVNTPPVVLTGAGGTTVTGTYPNYTITTPAGGGANTLGQAYNQGGAGAGRIITANNGPVEINVTSGNAKALVINTNQLSTFGIDATHTGTGVAIRGKNTNAANTFPAIQAETNSSTTTNAAVIGQNTGAGYGIAGQIPIGGTGDAAVYGNNLRANGGHGVMGVGYNGVVGQSAKSDGYGLYGINTSVANAAGDAIGTYGLGFVGVMGQTSDVVNGYAGYFTADVGVDGGVYAIGPGVFNLSDRRLKSNIRPIESALNKLMKVEPKTYTITTKSKPNNENGEIVENSRVEFGVIAQELEEIFPTMISEKAFFKNAGDETIYKSVNYEQLIPVMIQAIKELNEKVESLEKELNNKK